MDAHRRGGTHRCKKKPVQTPDGEKFEYHHGITVRRLASIHEASSVLWHELKHAQQAERFDPPWAFFTQYAEAGGVTVGAASYRANPYEIEARECEQAHEGQLLVKRILEEER
jgi:hypothetical protein